MAVLHHIFDTETAGTVSQVQIVDTKINTATGEREERVAFSGTLSYLSVTQYDTYWRIDYDATSDTIDQLWGLRFDRAEIGKNLVSQREVKWIFDVNNPDLALVMHTYRISTYNPGDSKYRVSYLLPNENSVGFFLNSGIQIPLQNGAKALENIKELTPQDHHFLDWVMERQKSDFWAIRSKPEEKESVEPAVMDEIKAVFSAMTDSESRIIDMKELKIIKGAENSQEELERMIGMDNIKQEIELLEARLGYMKAMQKMGYMPSSTSTMHMCFLGAPGTGKTTVARIITGVLSKYGYVKKNKCIEINARQMIGSYIGQTPFRTATIIKAAMGGVLFVDEAYSLLSNFQNDTYGAEAIAQLLKQMEDDRGNLIVILAGYDADMQRFLDVNEGMRSRINKYIRFENYSAIDTMQILLLTLRKANLRITRPALEKLMCIVKKACVSSGFANGRFARNLYEKLLEEHSYYVYMNGIKGEQADTICEAAVTDRLSKQILDAQR